MSHPRRLQKLDALPKNRQLTINEPIKIYLKAYDDLGREMPLYLCKLRYYRPDNAIIRLGLNYVEFSASKAGAYRVKIYSREDEKIFSETILQVKETRMDEAKNDDPTSTDPPPSPKNLFPGISKVKKTEDPEPVPELRRKTKEEKIELDEAAKRQESKVMKGTKIAARNFDVVLAVICACLFVVVGILLCAAYNKDTPIEKIKDFFEVLLVLIFAVSGLIVKLSLPPSPIAQALQRLRLRILGREDQQAMAKTTYKCPSCGEEIEVVGAKTISWAGLTIVDKDKR